MYTSMIKIIEFNMSENKNKNHGKWPFLNLHMYPPNKNRVKSGKYTMLNRDINDT